MTDIALGAPVGGFYWRGRIPGELCGAKVKWACDYAGAEAVAIPPFIDIVDEMVVVTNLVEGSCPPRAKYLSPGTLTLTPTVTCPNQEDPDNPIVTELAPLVLVIGGPPIVDVCPLVNPGFEDGDLTGWIEEQSSWYMDTSEVHGGVYSAYAANDLAWISQTVCMNDGATKIEFDGWAYFSDDFDTPGQPVQNIARIELLDSGDSVLATFETLYTPANSVIGWNNFHVETSGAIPGNATKVKVAVQYCVNGTYGHFNTNRLDDTSLTWT